MSDYDSRGSQGVEASDEGGLDLQKYLVVVFKRRWLILSTITLVTGAVAVFTFTRTRIYRATATVIVGSSAPSVLGKEVRQVVDLSSGAYWNVRQYMQTQQNVIKSKFLALRVAKKMRLDTLPAFWGDRGSDVADSAKGHQLRTVEAAADRLRAAIGVKNVGNSKMLEISVRHPSPKLAAELADAVAAAYLAQNIDYKLEQTTGAKNWLSTQKDTLKDQLHTAELALYQFKKDNNIVSLSMEDKQTLITRTIEKLNETLTDTRMKRMALDARRKELRRVSKKAPEDVAISAVMDNLSVRTLKEAYLTERQAYIALLQRYGDKYPAVLEHKARMDTVRKEFQREVDQVIASMRSDYREVRSTEMSLAAALQKAKDEALELNKREMDYRRLKREKENIEKLYSLVLTREKESSLTGRLRMNNLRILDNAEVPRVPIKPRVLVNMAVGLALGLLLAIGLAFLVDSLDRSVRSQHDIDQIPNLTYLGMIPRIPGSVNSRNQKRRPSKPEVDLIVHRNPKSQVAEACRSIRTNLLFVSPDRPMHRILVSSAGAREGKTTTVANLAITMAQSGSRVVVVDTDMRRPRAHKLFGISGKEGVTNILLGDGDIDKLAQPTEVPDLYLLPCGPTPLKPAELCQSKRFKKMLDDLAERFDRVILDSPPVMAVTDAVVLSTLVDGTVLIARTSQTSRVALSEASRQITDVGGNLLGCILNDLDPDSQGYGYYSYRKYGYYRYQPYQYGYGHYGEKEEEETVG